MFASVLMLTGCATADKGTPQPAYSDPVPLPEGPVRIYDNTDVFKGSETSDLFRVTTAVEDFYRNAGSYEVKQKAMEAYQLEDDTKRSVAIIRLYAPLKEFTKTGNLKDNITHRYFASIAQDLVPDPSLGKYTYDFVLNEKAVKVEGDTATVTLDGSVHLINGNSIQVPEGSMEIKMVKSNGEWFIDMPQTLG